MGACVRRREAAPRRVSPRRHRTPHRHRGEEIGWQGGVTLTPGQHAVSDVRSKTGLIASAYGVARSQVVIEEVGDDSRARLLVVQRTYLDTPRPWTGPTLDAATGTIPMGTLVTGERAAWQAWIPGEGARHGWISGANGSGKTGAVDCMLGSLLSAGLTVLDLTDLKGGISLPQWRDHAYRYGTSLSDGRLALRRGNAVIDARMAAMQTMTWTSPDGRTRTGRSVMDPSPDWPLYVVCVEEWPELASETAQVAAAERIARLGRAVGVVLYLISQGATLADTFGGSTVLRTQLQAGNVIALWSGRTAGQIAVGGAGENVDLSAIPRGRPGTGYILSAAQPRAVLGRIDHVTDSWAAASHARPAVIDAASAAAVQAAEASTARQVLDPEEDARPPVDMTRLGPVQAAVLTHLREHGPSRTGEIVAATNGLDGSVRAALAALKVAGHVTNPAHGTWEATR